MDALRYDVDEASLRPLLGGILNVTLQNLMSKHQSVTVYLRERFSSDDAGQILVANAAAAMKLTLADGQGHSHALGEDGDFLLHISTIAASEEDAREWYGREWGGYYKFFSALASNPEVRGHKYNIWFHLIFGRRATDTGVSFWLSTALLPLSKQGTTLLGWWGLPMKCLTDEERALLAP